MRDNYSADGREIHEECGVFGVYGVANASNYAYYALHSLQHRGQQGCGIVTTGDGKNLKIVKGAGLVHEIFNGENLSALNGNSVR